MFDNESESINHKGLFTFYRQQAEYEQKVRREKALTRKNIINQEKTRIQQKDGNQTEKEGQPIQMTKRQTKQRRSFEELNKEHIKKLSGKNRVTPVSSSKQLGSEVVVILKGNRNKLKQDLKLNKLNLRYQSQQFSFMGRKTPDSFRDVSNPQIYFPQHMQDNEEEDATFKKSMRRNQSLNDRYLHAKSKLEGELLLSKEIKSNAHPFEPVKFEAVKKINILEEAALANKQSEALKYEIHSAHRRVPPKLLASILKSQTNEIIRNMRKSIEKEKIGKFQAQGRNHSYIEYGNYDLQKIQLDVSGLNQKQRRLISIFSKFNKKL